MFRRSWMLLGVIALSSLAIAAPKKPAPANAQKPKDTTSLVGKAAPEFSAKTIDGKEVSLANEKGNVVLMDFWATWCPPCKKSLPHIQEISANKELASRGLKVWAVDTNWNGESIAKAQAFVKQNSYTFTVPFDADDACKNSFLANGIPTTVIVGRDGTVKKVFIGFGGDKSAEAIKKAVEAALKEEAPTKTS